MNTLATKQLALTKSQFDSLSTACSKIAPTWPLDKLIAVNPYWEMRDMTFEKVAARLSTLAGIACQMPREYYRSLYQQGLISQTSLDKARKEQASDLTLKELIAELHEHKNVQQWLPFAALLDNARDSHKMGWCHEIVHQISQFCADFYRLEQQTREVDCLYSHWLTVTQLDRGISIVMDEALLQKQFLALPQDKYSLIAIAIDELNIPIESLEYYAHALLLDINGWAAWVAYERWQGQLYDQNKDDMLALVAIRLSWELVIARHLKLTKPKIFSKLKAQFDESLNALPDLLAIHEKAQAPLWVWAKAAELTYQEQLNQQLNLANSAVKRKPKLQAAFCIDVRSEVIRRALESQSNEIETLGFAGFFGLPLELAVNQSPLKRPQLPGLLKPIIKVSSIDAKQSFVSHNHRARWQQWQKGAVSSFSMVESVGVLYSFKLLANSLFNINNPHPVHLNTNVNEWVLENEQGVLTSEQKAELVKGILHAMGLKDFAPKVLLVGHGSHTANNLHAAGFDCGACGGQTGEVNVRVLTHLLNDSEVRKILLEKGVNLGETEFIAAIHNTTTDQINCFSQLNEPDIEHWLSAASNAARRERIKKLQPELANESDKKIAHALIKRSRDWSQVQPEWGLANNAAFIIAPRHWTENLNLEGRSFLHDYTWQADTGFAILELILTAPMIVTNWINMQYNASVFDNHKFGCGNKVLHNAVTNNMGVFEGNGGDLRIGLSLQSLHNGKQWMHQPQRLAVYVAAPQEAIEEIINTHENVRQLIDNNWLYLNHWDGSGKIIRYYRGQWLPQTSAR